MAKKLYVGNLSFDTTDQELESIFSEHGNVTSASVVTDRYTGKSRGFGFVEFVNETDAKKAKDAVDGKEFGGRSLRVDEAKDPRESRGGDRSRSYSSDRNRSRY
ncbi:TPA: RNA-binding protein [bacterium]|jgi:RNA recognition motif-containing protein|nr:RNA-binding protein [bacterium]